MADMQPQPPQQGVQQVRIISSGGGASGTRPLQLMSNVVDGQYSIHARLFIDVYFVLRGSDELDLTLFSKKIN